MAGLLPKILPTFLRVCEFPPARAEEEAWSQYACHGTPLLIGEAPDTTLLCDPQHFLALSTCERLPALLGTWPLPSSKSAVAGCIFSH